MTDTERALQAETLVNALPYIQKYRDKIIVVKYGGNAMLNEELKRAVMNDMVLLSFCFVPWASTWFWYTAADLR